MINPHSRLYSSRSRGTVRSRSLDKEEAIGKGCGCLLTPFIVLIMWILRVSVPLAIIAGSVYLILYILRSFGLV